MAIDPVADLNLHGPAVARPGPSRRGRRYLADDTGEYWFDTGDTWLSVGSVGGPVPSRARTLRAPLDVGVVQTIAATIVSATFTGLPGTPRLLRAVLTLTTVGALPATDWWVIAQLAGFTQTRAFPGGLTQPVGVAFMWTGVAVTAADYLAEVVAIASDTVVVETHPDRSNLVIEDLGEPAS